MRSIPSALLNDLKADATSIAFLWTIEMADGRIIRGTEHDEDLTLSPVGSPDKYAGHYPAIANVTMGDISANTDLSVDNLEVTGAFILKENDSPIDVTVIQLTVEDVESGILDRAPVTVLVCSWRNPEHGYFIVKTGHLGTITHDSDGKYITEVRGLTQALTQTIIRTFSATCNVVKFGDNRCRFNVAGLTISGVVVVNSNNTGSSFAVTISGSSPYAGGTLKFTSGLNTGFSREVKLDPNHNGGIVTFWETFPEDIVGGDTFSLTPGCDRQFNTCKDIYSNLVHWRGYGYFIPGVNEITAGPAKGMAAP